MGVSNREPLTPPRLHQVVFVSLCFMGKSVAARISHRGQLFHALLDDLCFLLFSRILNLKLPAPWRNLLI